MRITITILWTICALWACKEDDKIAPSIEVPETYAFERNGESTVNYQGQNDRLAQVEEIKAKLLSKGDMGNIVSEQALTDAYENTGDNGGGLFSFSSSRQLKDKTFAPDVDANFFGAIFRDLADASVLASNGSVAKNGVPGLLVRENSGKTVLVDAKGREFTQMIEKGLMGAVFYNQIYNVYLTDSRTGDDVDNVTLHENQPYTDLEHHWDEAFGYWNPPLDFTSNWPSERIGETKYWSRYSNTVDNVLDGNLGTNDAIMNAFKTGRTAIVNQMHDLKNEQKEILYDQLDLVAAAVTVHYINSTLGNLNEGKTGEAFHTLTEAWAFANALRYNPYRRLSLDEIEQIKETDFGSDGNFWNVTAAGLNNAKNKIVNAYPELKAVQDKL